MEHDDICEGFKGDYDIEDWAYCINVTINHTMFQELNWTHIQQASANYSCTDYFQSFHIYQPVAYSFLIPLICFLGIVGNVLNIVVLTRGKLLSTMDTLEKSATYGLIALALSDLLFCVLVFPNAIVPQQTALLYEEDGHILYYRLYSQGIVNTFVMTSSWLIVIIAINRLVVVAYPLHARMLISGGKTAAAALIILVFSVLVTVPYYLIRVIRPCLSPDGIRMVEAPTRYEMETTRKIVMYIMYIWPVFSHLIPFVILLVCNVGIIVMLRRAYAGRRQSTNQKGKDSSRKVTLTLIIIVFLYCILVFPGEVLKFTGHYDQLAQGILNVLQSVNFAFNFVLYCLVNPTFRTTTKALLMCRLAEVRQHGHRSTTRMTELRSKTTKHEML